MHFIILAWALKIYAGIASNGHPEIPQGSAKADCNFFTGPRTLCMTK